MTHKNEGGWNAAPDYTPQRGFWRDQLLILALLGIGVLIAIFAARQANAQSSALPEKITSIYWSDADSGRINGSLKFRLNSIDAPETGGVGAAIGGAQCELERERGYAAKEWIVGLSREAELSITNEYGLDKYGRLIVDLSADGKDLGSVGVEAGFLKAWPHKGTKSLAKKPKWCTVK